MLLPVRTINDECNKTTFLISGDVTFSWFLTLTLQQLCVYEQLQRQQQHHQNDTGHQETVEARRQQTDLPQRCPSPAARLKPVRPERWGEGGGRQKRWLEELWVRR